MRKKQFISEEMYDKICNYCFKTGRDVPFKSDKEAIDKILQHMKMLGEL